MEKCPWCKSEPEVCVTPLWHGSHGYHDCYDVTIECKSIDCPVSPKTKGRNTIYGGSIGEKIKEVTEMWEQCLARNT